MTAPKSLMQKKEEGQRSTEYNHVMTVETIQTVNKDNESGVVTCRRPSRGYIDT